ncbi:general odorant-binding protein 72-like isoform X2 [Anticarsia gemmatalis]|uniref:general odorant-binding protein 72-like isoform X2 n=1 Tax=Anticarsia gemmatalis TaxID=129554 RepID=UPI003F774AB1
MFRFLLVLAFIGFAHGMTRAQVKKTMTIMKNQCMPKNSVTEEQVGSIEQGVFPEDKNVKCYVACVYKNLQVIKNDRLDRAAISKQVDMLYPQELREPTKKAVESCIHVQDKYNDMCEGVFAAAKCLYETNPPCFIFP